MILVSYIKRIIAEAVTDGIDALVQPPPGPPPVVEPLFKGELLELHSHLVGNARSVCEAYEQGAKDPLLVRVRKLRQTIDAIADLKAQS